MATAVGPGHKLDVFAIGMHARVRNAARARAIHLDRDLLALRRPLRLQRVVADGPDL